MKRLLRSAISTFAIVFVRELAWRAARNLMRPRPQAMKAKKRKVRVQE